MEEWMNSHIKFNPAAKRYEAFDEAGQLLGRYFTEEAAKIALRRYGDFLEKDANVVRK